MKQNFRWELRKGSKKAICPECGRKTFVPYVSIADGTLAGAIYGRCDREKKCGYIKYPNGVKTPSKGLKKGKNDQINKMQPIRIHNSVVLDSLFQAHTFRRYLIEMFGDDAKEALANYYVGGFFGASIWWQIDQQKQVHTGKIMGYGADGHRLKRADGGSDVGWIHKHSRFADKVQGEELQQCFFGQHLLPVRPDAIVCVVESEKTAVCMSIVMPDKLWLACGGLQGLTVDKCQALNGRQVVLVPDKGCYWQWKLIGDNYGWKTSRDIEFEEAVHSGDDIWDLFEPQVKAAVDGLKAKGIIQ